MLKTVGEIGEKALIRDLITPLFNRTQDWESIGDDCAFVRFDSSGILLSTDRVPADLIAFKLGIIDYRGLGHYLATLNISDIAASGGDPVGLLLNLAMPDNFPVSAFEDLLAGVNDCVSKFDCRVLGGDLSSALELSLSATSVGRSHGQKVLRRSLARPGDVIFTSRPIGLTPAAFAAHLRLRGEIELATHEWDLLNNQFRLEPLVQLGRQLARCSAVLTCMDNTDGLGQTLAELAMASNAAFIVDHNRCSLPPLVNKIAELCHEGSNLDFALGAGADFALVGTYTPGGNAALPEGLIPIGYVDDGAGIWIEEGASRRELTPKGWNYFDSNRALATQLSSSMPK